MFVALAACSAIGCAVGGRPSRDGAVSTSDGGPQDAGADSGIVPGSGRVCSVCTGPADCASGFFCVDLDAGGKACLPGCDATAPDCPGSFSCVEREGAGEFGSVCAPTGRPCCADGDGDMHGQGMDCMGSDCDDGNPDRNASALEVCDTIDNDCNDVVDDPSSLDLCPDLVNIAAMCMEGECSGTECRAGFGDCDEEMPGCETALTTATDCGACGTPCEAPGATTTCETGTCEISGCMTGFSDCDGNTENGCEVGPEATMACPDAMDLGTFDGDTACQALLGCPANDGSWDTFATQRGAGSAWFRARVREDSTCIADIEHRVQLTVPTGANYDLFVYRSCGGSSQSSTNGSGQPEELVLTEGDNGIVVEGVPVDFDDDDFDYWIEVRYRSGEACDQWTLTLAGHDC